MSFAETIKEARQLTPQERNELKRSLPKSCRSQVLGFFASCPTRHAHGVREYANAFIESNMLPLQVQHLFWMYVGKMLGLRDKPTVVGVQMVSLELL